MFNITRDHRRLSYIAIIIYLMRYLVKRVTCRFGKIGWPVGFERGVIIKGADCVFIGNNCFFNKNSSIHVPEEFVTGGKRPRVVIEDKVTLDPGSSLNAVDLITIKKNVLIAANVYIADHIHKFGDVSLPIRFQGVDKVKPVLIRENAWIGQNAVINPGVSVGKNSVVTRSVPDFSLAVGNPAKVVKQYDMKLKKWVRTAVAVQLLVPDLPALLLAL